MNLFHSSKHQLISKFKSHLNLIDIIRPITYQQTIQLGNEKSVDEFDNRTNEDRVRNLEQNAMKNRRDYNSIYSTKSDRKSNFDRNFQNSYQNEHSNKERFDQFKNRSYKSSNEQRAGDKSSVYKTNRPRVKANYDGLNSKFSNEQVKKELSFGYVSKFQNEGRKKWLESEFLENDPDNMERMEVLTSKRPRNYYLFGIRDAIYKEKELGVHKALELYREMKLDRKLINADFYKMLIKGCALVGYVEKAFELYGEYLSLQPPVINRSIVTSMFNCCSNSPDKEIGLKNAKELYDQLRLTNYTFNLMNYNCLIKTFGLLGDLDTAFAFVDTIIENKFHPNVDTFSNLLVASCTNQEQGLAIATNLIQAMRFLNIRPNILIYNLLYRITRDCHFGTEEELNEQLKQFKYPDAITSDFLRNVLFRQRTLLKRNYTDLLQAKKTESNNLTPAIYKPNESDLICLNFLGSSVQSIENQLKIVDIDYSSLSAPENRLKLIGGVDYLIKCMLMDEIKPNIKTISLLTALVPQNEESEMKLIKYADQFKIKLDTDFFNMLIRRANLRKEKEVGTKYLGLMTSRHLAPNIQTYGVMAIACESKAEIKSFMIEMEQFGIRPNEVIMSCLIQKAALMKDFILLKHLVQYLGKYNIKPTTRLLEYLALGEEIGSNIEIKKTDDQNVIERKKFSQSTYAVFKKYLNDYLSENSEVVDENQLNQFKTEPIPRNDEYYKFKKQMTELLREKRRYMNEMAESHDNETEFKEETDR